MDGGLILERLAGNKNILLLQGPCGWFFSRLAKFLKHAGCEVDKVNFNAGDDFFYRHDDAFNYRGNRDQWTHWLEQLMARRATDCIMLFGDCRAHHAEAIKLARKKGIRVLVFEEGYLRPGFVTLEPNGVNANSDIPQKFNQDRPHTIGMLPARTSPIKMPAGTPGQRLIDFLAMGLQSSAYVLATRLGSSQYPHYIHHKPFRIRREIGCGFLSAWRKLVYRLEDLPSRYRLRHRFANKYFVVPLQVFNDSQLTHHCNYADQGDFIEAVVASFARSSQSDHQLVFKHHPMDRGHRYYGELLEQLAARYSLTGRVHYLHDIRLPVLFRYALGVVTVNSTAGLSALYHGKPVVCMGRSLYDLDGLTHRDGIDRFWRAAHPPQATEVLRFRTLLRDHALLPGNFYRGRPILPASQPVPQQNIGQREVSLD